MPALFRKASDQVRATLGFGSNKHVAVALVDSESNDIYAFVPLGALVNLLRDVAEVGQGSKIKSYVRELERIAGEIRRAAS